MTNTMQTRSEFSEYLTRLTESLPLLTFSSGSVCERDEEKEKEDRAQEKKYIAEVNVSLGPFPAVQCNGVCLSSGSSSNKSRSSSRRAGG